MSSHFNFKSLAFYGVAIGLVLLLFKAVTAYGEANLKAPAPIGGRYRLTLAQNLPNCLKSNTLVLTIQQSGIYLNGFLLPAETTAEQARASEKNPSLTGQLSNQQLSLAGTVPSSTFCNAESARSKDNSSSSAVNVLPEVPSGSCVDCVSIQSRVEGENLEGKITLSGIPEAIGFTAQPEAPVQPSENSTH